MNITNDELSLWRKIIPECKIVFDVGCQNDNIFYDINPELQEIHLFDPKISHNLLDEIKDKKNVFFNNYALGNANVEEMDFYASYGSFLHRTEEPKFINAHQIKKVSIIKLSEYVIMKKITHIDFLKIDTEGFDFEVIKGCDGFINNIKYIQFEDFINFYGGKVLKDIFSFLKGWNIYSIGGIPANYLATKESLNDLNIVEEI